MWLNHVIKISSRDWSRSHASTNQIATAQISHKEHPRRIPKNPETALKLH